MTKTTTMTRNEKHATVNADLRSIYGDTISRAQLFDYKKKTGVFAEWLQKGPESNRVGRGLYAIPGVGSTKAVVAKIAMQDRLVPVASAEPVATPAPEVLAMSVAAEHTATDMHNASLTERMEALKTGASLLSSVPARNKTFVAFGDYDMLEQVIASRQFFPVYISVCPATARPSRWNKPARNSAANMSAPISRSKRTKTTSSVASASATATPSSSRVLPSWRCSVAPSCSSMKWTSRARSFCACSP